ncbi:protein COFACTOR ASSEMBLY OF COMPLEX C SUBUNIT B CCB2, chloroplastic isoform X2 [Arachis hypogaea]|uniref:protein COFACTOR ASSEMBLY OF COMPLEX C SUBUNIT B CCB2, chloroplastic isoform X2 n=1 Tax=Arachis hypogaea TaxID=3818 RepID=UPI000DEC6C52|nr:protein COFACTOR ASSEMBLY OF COMPLEX C SUBUNIT B CCB2, chloroplastic isoform X2 [Arachis hypogaea]QHO14196.1 Protein COFACTOR ASSEMBLY OF COMPLEX C SUBUNIT B CCB2 [Arachis hypogaea]QHO14197.1 Protein COFACTOR ASSEMBLY OF COMPLEX C SUBUNIT B CCB2 [Arachis hypogaea]
MSTIIFNLRPCLPSHKPTFTTSTLSSSPTTTLRVRATFQDSKPPNTTQQQQLNLSVLRFTLGIPGLDESYLPRWIGYGFGSLLFLNHFLGTDSATMTPAQLTTEVLGLSLASFSVALPYLGKFLKGAQPVDQATLPDGTQQIFVMSQDIADGLKEDLAWASYVLLRNSNAIAALIFVQRDMCARGYWNIPDGSSKEILLDWFAKKIEKADLVDLKDTLYFPQDADSEFPELVSKGTSSLLVQPVLVNNQTAANSRKPVGFILLASAARYAFSTKDRAWIAAVANKLSGWCRASDEFKPQ